MKRSRFTTDQIVRMIAEAELPTSSTAAVSRKYGVGESTLYRWRKAYGGMSTSETKRLRVMEEENRALKRLVAEKELELQVMMDIVKKGA